MEIGIPKAEYVPFVKKSLKLVVCGIMDVVAQSSKYYRPIMSQTLVEFVEEVSQKTHLEDSDRVGLKRLLERIPQPRRPSLIFFTKCLHSVNSAPSSSASMNSQLVIDMWECARAYPDSRVCC